jgi:hypothetical protein
MGARLEPLEGGNGEMGGSRPLDSGVGNGLNTIAKVARNG